MRLTTTIFQILFWLFISTTAFAQGLSIAYCQAEVFTDACSDGEEATTCTPKVNERAAECSAFLDTTSVKWEIAWDNFRAQIADYINEILGTIALFFAAAAAYFKTALSRLKSRIFDPLIRRAADISTSGLNVLVVGKGGSGKTSLIKALAGSSEINPNVANAINEFYSISHEIDTVKQDVVNRKVLRFYFSDHVGQDFSTIPETAYFQEKKLGNLPKAIIFVVDLFDTGEAYGVDALYQAPDPARIAAHTDVYIPEMLDMITRGLQNEATIFLFINKTDKLDLPFSQIERLCLDAYDDLINRLRAIPGTELKVVVGSAESGQSVMGAKVGPSNLGSSVLYEGVAGAAALIES